MKDERWQPGRHRGGAGGYKEDEKRRKRAVRLWIVGGLLVAAVLIASCWLLLFRRPAAEQNAGGAGQKMQTATTASESKEEVRRKNIYDRNLRELAISFKVDSIYVKPLEFDNIEKTVALLVDTLGLDEKAVLEELKTQRTFKWVAKKISPEQAAKVMALHLPGVYFYEQEQRFDPNRANTAAIIGEVKDEHGLSGIELFYDNLLLNPAADSQPPAKPGGGGKGIVLTLDARIQLLLEQEMTQLRNELKANGTTTEDLTGISAIIMDATTGGILSYVRLPFFGGRQPSALTSLESGDRIFSGTINPGPLAAIFKAAAELDQGLAAASAPAAEGAPSEGGQLSEQQVVKKFIEERTPEKAKEKPREKPEKEGPGAPQPKSPWGKLPDGAYATEWLAALLARQLAVQPGAAADFSDFGKILSRVGPCKADLPGENGGRDTGLGLLCGFAALVNGGAGVTPHLLKAIFDTGGKPEEWPWPPMVNKVIGSEASRGLVLFLRDIAHPAGQIFFADVLQPGPAAGPSPDRVGGQGEAAAPSAAQDAAAGREEGGAAAKGPQGKPADAGQPGAEGKPGEATVLDRCDELSLAAIPLAKPELVMLVAANDAAIDLTKPSALRRHAEAVLTAALRVYHQREAGVVGAESLSRQEIFQRWLMKNRLLGFDVTAGFKGDKETMIDVRGMSIRKALQELNRFDVKIVIEGSGIVKRQHPAPGGKMPEGSVVILKAEAKR